MATKKRKQVRALHGKALLGFKSSSFFAHEYFHQIKEEKKIDRTFLGRKAFVRCYNTGNRYIAAPLLNGAALDHGSSTCCSVLFM